MSANQPACVADEALLARRDVLLRRIVVLCALASFTAFGLAIATSIWSHSADPAEAVAMNSGY
ncbi:MAG: hypothetical protein FGM15_02640 [Chthoniobacterales bacterium]|nr:hypothetical protein [Chthoniobacterales bacterium]